MRASMSSASVGSPVPTRRRRSRVDSLRQRFYPALAQRDTVTTFSRRLEGLATPGLDVLDLGAGAGDRNAYALKGKVRRVVGVDADPRVGQNPLLDAGLRGDIAALPFRDRSFDVVFSIYVLEHVEQPQRLASEIARVLRPGGVFLSLTPNLAHYVSLISRFTPTGFHRWINERRGRPAEDTFPTCYQLNTRSSLTRHFRAAGLETVSIDGVEVQPNYLTFSAATYLMGIAYERIVNASPALSALRVNLLPVFRKPTHG
jgi:SAM-dependent methyltransferase